MPFYTYVTDNCLKTAETHGLKKTIEKLSTQVIKNQNICGFENFRPSYFYKKSIGRTYRLIAWEHCTNGDHLIVFLKVLSRSSGDYDEFLENRKTDEAYFCKLFLLPEKSKLQKILLELKKTPEQALPPVLTESESNFLYALYNKKNDTLQNSSFLETETWVKQLKSHDNREKLGDIYDLIFDNSSFFDPDISRSDNKMPSVLWNSKKSVGLIYCADHKNRNFIFLEPIFSVSAHNNINAILKKYNEITENDQDLSRQAVRAYPSYILCGRDEWFSIQKDDEANLALSPEEESLLNGIRTIGLNSQSSGHEISNFPVFINGRAGCGKSTMLQYIAADYLEYVAEHDSQLIPLYMTCSEELLKKAKETTLKLLTAQSRRIADSKALDSKKAITLINRSFFVFRDLLKKMIPEENRKDYSFLFDENNERFINYPKFLRLWEEKYNKTSLQKTVSPDICWHTIRTYVKGMRSSLYEDFTPEKFKELPKRSKSVSDELYCQIYSEIWENWFKPLCEENSYWDDQDLAAAVLESCGEIEPGYGAIICDEAQDFTKIELDLLFQLSIYSKRTLKPSEIRQVPFIFAGDPLQTINPTGFRWERLQAEYYERYRSILMKEADISVTVNHEELGFNYRSNRGVVNFSNLIQLFRSRLLEDNSITPQESWWIHDMFRTVYFSIDECRDYLLQKTEYVKIVNCEEGEEAFFAADDDVFRDTDKKPKAEQHFIRNIFSPIKAKGLEFPVVILYKFGESLPDELISSIRNGMLVEDVNPQKITYEYFFNKLYVAVSRAKKQLIIVDTEKAINNFWSFFINPETSEKFLKEHRSPLTWQNKIDHAVKGSLNSWEGHNINSYEQGQELETQGKLRKDPYLMWQAYSAYCAVNETVKADECLAYYHEFGNNFADAGKMFEKLHNNNEALKCYWKGKLFSEYLALSQKISSGGPQLPASKFMSSIMNSQNFMQELSGSCQDETWIKSLIYDNTWVFILEKLFTQGSIPQQSKDTLAMMFNLCETFFRNGLKISSARIAEIAYYAELHSEAVKFWDLDKKTETREYWISKTKTENFPHTLPWHYKLGNYEFIIDEWDRKGHTFSDENAVKTVAASALQLMKFEIAASLYEKIGSIDNREYYRAKAGIESFPANMFWYVKAGMYQSAVKEWKQNSPGKIQFKDLSIDLRNSLGKAFIYQNEHNLCLSMLEENYDNYVSMDLFNKALENRNNSLADACITVMLKNRCFKDHLEVARHVADKFSDKKRSALLHAYILELEGDLLSSGNLFLENNRITDASRLLLKQKDFKKLLTVNNIKNAVTFNVDVDGTIISSDTDKLFIWNTSVIVFENWIIPCDEERSYWHKFMNSLLSAMEKSGDLNSFGVPEIKLALSNFNASGLKSFCNSLLLTTSRNILDIPENATNYQINRCKSFFEMLNSGELPRSLKYNSLSDLISKFCLNTSQKILIEIDPLLIGSFFDKNLPQSVTLRFYRKLIKQFEFDTESDSLIRNKIIDLEKSISQAKKRYRIEDEFRITCSEAVKKLKIEHLKTLDDIVFNCNGMQLIGNSVKIESIEDTDNRKKWTATGWNLTISVEENEESIEITISKSDDRIIRRFAKVNKAISDRINDNAADT